MKPLKQKRSIEGISRAKMYIKRDLEFLSGYPIADGRWVSQHEGREYKIVSITRDHIHQATYTMNKLIRDFPKALPKIVGDVEKWSKRHRSLLEHFKLSIHQEKPLVDLPVSISREFGEEEEKLYKRLVRDNPDLIDVIHSFLWVTYLNPECFTGSLVWLDTHATYIKKIFLNLGYLQGLKTIIEIWRLSNLIGDKRVKPILLWASDARIYKFIMEQGYQYAYKVGAALSRKKDAPVPDVPKARFGEDIVKWIDWLASQDSQTVKRSAELFDLVCDSSFIDQWEDWWKLLNTSVKTVGKIPRPLTRNNPMNGKLDVARDKIKRMGENTPPSVRSRILFDLLREWSLKQNIDHYKVVFRALEILPVQYNKVPLRIAFWFYWEYLFEENCVSKGKTSRLIIQEFYKYIQSHYDFSKGIDPWSEVLDSWKNGGDSYRYIYSIDDEILDEITEHKNIPIVFQLMSELYQDKNFDGFKRGEKRNLLILIDIVSKTDVKDHFFQLRRNGISCEYISRRLFELVLEITRQDPKFFGSILKVIYSTEEKFNDICQVMKPIIEACKTSEYGSILIDAIIGGQIKIVCDIALKTGIMRGFEENAIVLPEPIKNNAEWICNYPEELHDDLLRLAISDKKAETTAKRILSKNYPDQKCLEKEMAEIIQKIQSGDDPQGFLKLRLNNLNERIEASREKRMLNKDAFPVLGEQRLKNLSKKLKHAAVVKVVERWNEDIDCKFKTFMASKLKTEEFPQWLKKKDILEIILSTGELNPAFQSIVHKILERRGTTLPWDFRDEKENNSFLVSLAEKGINTAPWTDDEVDISEKLNNGEEVIFSIERDPIEIFKMGMYFQTCLSPGGINFFSVFSNIIDINKQVLYGKTRNGIVKARALIALTDSGGILIFHPYCNDSNLNFESILKRFVHILAKKMNTVVLAKGNVSKLIAPDWYDDGPCNLTEKFQFALGSKEPGRKISDLDADELLMKMKEAVEPLGLNELTIPMFIFLPELKECPALVEILHPYILKLKNLPDEALYKYTEALIANQKSEMLKKLVPVLAERSLKQYDHYNYWSIKHWVELLTEISPSYALMVLKKTSKQYDFGEECDSGDKMAAFGMAYLKLNRPIQAVKMFSGALEKQISREAHEICLSKLTELKKRK